MNLYIVLKLKKILKTSMFFIVLILLLTLSETNFNSVSVSINMFLNKVFPSLFPFMLFTEILLSTNVIDSISRKFEKILYKFFRISPHGVSAIISGFLCGFPMGAKAVNVLYENSKISKKEAYYLLKFTNNCNPAFILSTIGIVLFKNIKLGILILISHYLSAIIIGCISNHLDDSLIIHERDDNLKLLHKKTTKLKKKAYILNEYNKTYLEKSNKRTNKKKNSNFMEIIKSSMFNSFKSLVLICGFIIIFNLISNSISMLFNHFNISSKLAVIVSSILEMTTGSYNIYISDFSYIMKICLISFSLGFSGLSIIFQIYATISKYDFSLKYLIKYKTLQGILSFIITYDLINIKNISNINYINILLLLVLISLLYFLFRLVFTKNKKTVV